MTTLDAQGLRKTFRLHLQDGAVIPVLDGVSLTVRAGECIALSGPSGAGKSTVLRSLFGNYRLDAGRILVRHGDAVLDLATADPRTVLAMRRDTLGYVSQFLRAMPRVPALDIVAERRVQAIDAADNVDHADRGDGIDPFDDARHDELLRAAREEARILLGRLNVPAGLWGLPPATFSGGEQQRVNIARGFVQPARLLLLDEPTASLDAANRRVVIGLIEEAKRRGAAIVGIFHDEEVREAVAERCIEIGAAAQEHTA